jgi:hypothetical protein
MNFEYPNILSLSQFTLSLPPPLCNYDICDKCCEKDHRRCLISLFLSIYLVVIDTLGKVPQRPVRDPEVPLHPILPRPISHLLWQLPGPFSTHEFLACVPVPISPVCLRSLLICVFADIAKLCIRVYVYTCIHVYMYTCIRVYMYTCIHVYMYTCIHVYRRCVCLSVCLCMCVCARVCVQSFA